MRFASLRLVLLVLAAGCATSFQGSAKFPGGPRGCLARCRTLNMEMSSYVYVGEYSTGCVCSLKRRASAQAAAGRERDSTAATSAAPWA